MRIRLIGIGDVGERVLLDTCAHFGRLGLDELLEKRLVVKLTKREFADTYHNLLNLGHEIFLTRRERAELRQHLARLMFSSPDGKEGDAPGLFSSEGWSIEVPDRSRCSRWDRSAVGSAGVAR